MVTKSSHFEGPEESQYAQFLFSGVFVLHDEAYTVIGRRFTFDLRN